MLILGEKEEKDGTVSVRKRFEGDTGILYLEEVKEQLLDEINNRRLTHRKKTEAATE